MKDSSGDISAVELKQKMVRLGVISGAEVDKLFELADKDKNGNLSREEVKRAVVVDSGERAHRGDAKLVHFRRLQVSEQHRQARKVELHQLGLQWVVGHAEEHERVAELVELGGLPKLGAEVYYSTLPNTVLYYTPNTVLYTIVVNSTILY